MCSPAFACWPGQQVISFSVPPGSAGRTAAKPPAGRRRYPSATGLRAASGSPSECSPRCCRTSSTRRVAPPRSPPSRYQQSLSSPSVSAQRPPSSASSTRCCCVACRTRIRVGSSCLPRGRIASLTTTNGPCASTRSAPSPAFGTSVSTSPATAPPNRLPQRASLRISSRSLAPRPILGDSSRPRSSPAIPSSPCSDTVSGSGVGVPTPRWSARR